MKKILIPILTLLLIIFCAVGCSPKGNYDPKTVTIKVEFADFSASYKVSCSSAFVSEAIDALNTQEGATIIQTEDYNMGKRVKSILNTAVDLDNYLAYSYTVNGATPKYGIHEYAIKNGDIITFSYNKVTSSSITLAPRDKTLSNGYKNIKISINFTDYTATYSLKTDGIHLVDAIYDLNTQEGYEVFGVANSSSGKYVNEILQVEENSTDGYYFSFTLNNEVAQYGIDDTTISNGDEISFSYGKTNADNTVVIKPRA